MGLKLSLAQLKQCVKVATYHLYLYTAVNFQYHVALVTIALTFLEQENIGWLPKSQRFFSLQNCIHFSENVVIF